MAKIQKAKEPFKFYTRMHLSELTGLRASTLGQLLEIVKVVNGSCIYHHTHRFLQQHQYLSPEPPNDFAYWVTEVLGEDELGERLASIDVVQFTTIRSLREKIVATIAAYLDKNLLAKVRFSREGEEFHFIKSISFVLPTNYVAYDLKDFIDVLDKITIDSIYYHIFEARLRLEKNTNDFSNWIMNSVGDERMAREISHLDPYTFTLEGLRDKVIGIIKKGILV
ncbi:MAG: hypothetical protein A2987_03470 [Omnitrophica bacterium RIFCSPLOWO2_01_FULL_45_10]|nr:MAG: hypothetical protein A2987_03470 [Omnitrophica bacterium RIFCSPLOWO2_01_FULL_45_10]